MADPLYAGAMGSAADASTPVEFQDSLASLIEDRYWALLDPDNRFDRTTNAETDRDRRRLFVAIAQGIVDYLHAHPGAFRVEPSGNLPADTRIEIDRTAP